MDNQWEKENNMLKNTIQPPINQIECKCPHVGGRQGHWTNCPLVQPTQDRIIK